MYPGCCIKSDRISGYSGTYVELNFMLKLITYLVLWQFYTSNADNDLWVCTFVYMRCQWEIVQFIFSGEKEGATKSLDSCQDLLTESKSENAQLLGRVHAAESQIEGLKKGKEEVIILASSRENLSSGFPKKRDSNQSPQLQRLVRTLKFCLKQVVYI